MEGWRERDHTGWWSDTWSKHAGRAAFTHPSDLSSSWEDNSTNTYDWLKLEGKQQSSKPRAWHQSVRTGQPNHHPDPVSWKIKSATSFLMTSMLWYKSRMQPTVSSLYAKRQRCVYDTQYHKSRGNTVSLRARVTVMLSRLLVCVRPEVKGRRAELH